MHNVYVLQLASLVEKIPEIMEEYERCAQVYHYLYQVVEKERLQREKNNENQGYYNDGKRSYAPYAYRR